MAKRTKMIGRVIVAIIVIAATIWITWMPIFTTLVLNDGVAFFRDNYQPNKDIHACICEETWAIWYFAGTKGLPSLKRFSQDPSLILSGRSTASNLFIHISGGTHLPTLRYELAQGHLTWLGRQYCRYLLNKDKEFLIQRGISTPEGTKH